MLALSLIWSLCCQNRQSLKPCPPTITSPEIASTRLGFSNETRPFLTKNLPVVVLALSPPSTSGASLNPVCEGPMKNSTFPLPEMAPVQEKALPSPLSSVSVKPFVNTSVGQPPAG